MIIARPKSIRERIYEIKDFEKILVAGCNGCEACGRKEVEILAPALRMNFASQDK